LKYRGFLCFSLWVFPDTNPLIPAEMGRPRRHGLGRKSVESHDLSGPNQIFWMLEMVPPYSNHHSTSLKPQSFPSFQLPSRLRLRQPKFMSTAGLPAHGKGSLDELRCVFFQKVLLHSSRFTMIYHDLPTRWCPLDS
jgi:hypothetical protein